MRLFLIISLLGGAIWWGVSSLGSGKGLYSSFASEKVAEKLSAPTRLVTDRGKEKKAPAAEAKEAVTPAKVPDSVSLLSAPAAPASSPETVAPAPVAAAAPVEPQETRTHRFVDRMPPELANGLQAFGVQALVDPVSRSVVMRGTAEQLTAASAALSALDLGADSCNARVWAVYVDSSQAAGWDLVAAVQSVAHADLGFSLGGGRATLDLSGDEIAAALAVIADGSTVDVVQRPQVALLHGREAVVESTSEVPLPTVSVSGTGLSQSGVTYRKVGLTCKINSYFLGRNRVRLDVQQENGLIGATVELGAGLSAPVIESQRVASSVEVSIGQAVVLGGVVTERRVKRKGLLRDTEETRKGALYVIVATSPLAPRAVPVDAWDAVDLGSLLPAKGWESEEADFLRDLGAK